MTGIFDHPSWPGSFGFLSGFSQSSSGIPQGIRKESGRNLIEICPDYRFCPFPVISQSGFLFG